MQGFKSEDQHLEFDPEADLLSMPLPQYIVKIRSCFLLKDKDWMGILAKHAYISCCNKYLREMGG